MRRSDSPTGPLRAYPRIQGRRTVTTPGCNLPRNTAKANKTLTKGRAAVVTGTRRDEEFHAWKGTSTRQRPWPKDRSEKVWPIQTCLRQARAHVPPLLRVACPPFPLWARIVCDILLRAVTATAAYVAIGSLYGARIRSAPAVLPGPASSRRPVGQRRARAPPGLHRTLERGARPSARSRRTGRVSVSPEVNR